MFDPATLAAVITATAVSLSQDRPSVEITLIGAILTQLGDTLATIGASQSFIEDAKATDTP